MLGSTDAASRAVVAEALVEAGPNARRQPHRFDPDGPWQRGRIAELYQASDRRLNYLGDWHSHPQGGGPSALDRSTARRIAETPAARCPSPVFLIVTNHGGQWQLRAYLFRGRRFKRLRVEVH
jgi:integrative and conjugative element protein (TIGR02256 family)